MHSGGMSIAADFFELILIHLDDNKISQSGSRKVQWDDALCSPILKNNRDVIDQRENS